MFANRGFNRRHVFPSRPTRPDHDHGKHKREMPVPIAGLCFWRCQSRRLRLGHGHSVRGRVAVGPFKNIETIKTIKTIKTKCTIIAGAIA